MPTRQRRAKLLGIDVNDLSDGRGRHGKHRRGNQHYNWSGGRVLSSHGYVKVQVGTTHPFADPNGYAYEHRLVLAAAGIAFESDDVVHHKNGDKTDNRLANLEVLHRSDHNAHHLQGRERDALGRVL